MKVSIVVALCLATAGVGYGQTLSQAAKALPPDTAYTVASQGANHRVWEKTSYELGPDGKAVPKIHRYIELATGMNYQDANGQWQESKEVIESYPGGAVARHGRYQVIFANNLNSSGAIDMQTPDGKRLRSNILGLMYYDTSTGDAVLVAQLQDSQGEIVSANQVLYPNAFAGLKADVQYTYRKGGFEQDVILHEQPPAPETYGMNPATTELEVFTEFINPPAAALRPGQAEADTLEPDQEVSWGTVQLNHGKAFNFGAQEPNVPVVKRYMTIQGRTYLLEKVSVKAIGPELLQLPEQASNQRSLPVMASKNFDFPQAPVGLSDKQPMKMAAADRPDQGYVLDYQQLVGGFTNYTFRSDTTYYISGSMSSYGTNTFEGGTVIKFAASGTININPGPPGTTPGIVWKGDIYRPVVFTAVDDNSIGQSIGSGTPTGYYGNPMLQPNVLSFQNPLSGWRVSYAKTALTSGGMNLKIYNAQFVNCQNGVNIYGGSLFLGNVLFANTATNLITGTASVSAQNGTFSGAAYLDSMSGSSTFGLTNCVLVNVTNLLGGSGTIAGWNNGFYQAPMVGSSATTNFYYPFQSVGGGGYYLASGCNFTNAGTTNIDATLLSGLKLRTTHPPIAYTNVTFVTATNFAVQAQRDTSSSPDLGYHYDPLDYSFGSCQVNSNITFSAGTAVGWFRTSSGYHHAGDGLHLMNSASAVFNGTATAPDYWGRLNTVQERDLTAGFGTGGLTGWGSSPSVASAIVANFLLVSTMVNNDNPFRDDYGYLSITANNSEFWSGGPGGYNIYLNLTNDLFFRAIVGAQDPGSCLFLQNCTMRGGQIFTSHGGTWPVSIVNSAFDDTTFSMDTNYTYCDYNAFLTNAARLPILGTHDVTNLLTFNWQPSWFGNFYLPSGSILIDSGSTNANCLGLYHFTTQTSQVPETNSIVDIGYHYVSTDTYGIPLDGNGDGIPDYLEDANGDGIFNAGDIGDWLPMSGETSAFEFSTSLKIDVYEPKSASLIP